MACQYLSESKGRPKQTLSRMVAFCNSFSKVQHNTTRREMAYLDPCVLGTIGNRSTELDRAGLPPHLSDQTLKERRLSRADRTDDRNDLALRDRQAGLRDLEHLLFFLRVLGSRDPGRTRNRTGSWCGGCARASFRLLLAFLVLLLILRFLPLVLSLALALVLSACWFWRWGVPGKGSIVQLKSVLEVGMPDLFVRQGFGFEHFLNTRESVVCVHSGIQGNGCWGSRSNTAYPQIKMDLRKNMRGIRSMLNKVNEVNMVAGSSE